MKHNKYLEASHHFLFHSFTHPFHILFPFYIPLHSSTLVVFNNLQLPSLYKSLHLQFLSTLSIFPPIYIYPLSTNAYPSILHFFILYTHLLSRHHSGSKHAHIFPFFLPHWHLFFHMVLLSFQRGTVRSCLEQPVSQTRRLVGS